MAPVSCYEFEEDPSSCGNVGYKNEFSAKTDASGNEATLEGSVSFDYSVIGAGVSASVSSAREGSGLSCTSDTRSTADVTYKDKCNGGEMCPNVLSQFGKHLQHFRQM